MKEQGQIHQANRREMLRLSGMGVLGGVAASSLITTNAHAESAIKIAHAMWIHGHSMQIEYPDRIPYQRRTGMSFDIEGKPGTDNWFHFAIPSPVIINDVRLRAKKVMFCFKTFSVDAFVRDVHLYDGGARIAMFNDINLSMDQPDVRLDVPERPPIGFGLGISLGVGFGVEAMDHHMEFYAAGCDFVV